MNRYQVTAVRDDEDFEIACDKIDWGTAFVRFSVTGLGLIKALRNDQFIKIDYIGPAVARDALDGLKDGGFNLPDFST